MAGLIKKTTGLTGLEVAKHPQQSLKVLYERILKVLQKIPDESAYKRHTEFLVRNRLSVILTEKDIRGVETKIDCGQAEELMTQAKRELDLSKRMAEWRVWENPSGPPPPNQWKWPIQ